MLDDFLCEVQSDELIPEGWDEELDDFEYDVLETIEQVKPHEMVSGSSDGDLTF